MRSVPFILLAIVVVVLPFLFRPTQDASVWEDGDPVLVVASPHNEAIRSEFGRAFSSWHYENFGVPVRIEWRSIGGTSEIVRYLDSEFIASFEAYWLRQKNDWPTGGRRYLTDHQYDGSDPTLVRMRRVLRKTDDPDAFGSGIDVFFGGGTYDHGKMFRKGLSVPAWEEVPTGILRDSRGRELIPSTVSGERWRGPGYIGAAVSTFGIVYNPDRLRDLGILNSPASWADLADSRYVGQLGLADPTKSGSITKAFEMLIHQQIGNAVSAAGYTDQDIDRYEALFTREFPPGTLPPGVPASYQAAVESGWIDGINLVRRLGANARYFTDSAGRVPIDVSSGNAAAGLAIDFYARFQAENSRGVDGQQRMIYVTPQGGSSVSADPISLLRGAPNREIAERFIEFVLRREGQILWNANVGTSGGPVRYALRRLPIRRDLYPSSEPDWQVFAAGVASNSVDDLSDPRIDPYRLSENFTYRFRWTGRLFHFHRTLIRVMCMDAGDELRSAWRSIARNGGESANPEASGLLRSLPPGVNWVSAHGDALPRGEEMRVRREWVLFFRQQYEAAEAAVQ